MFPVKLVTLDHGGGTPFHDGAIIGRGTASLHNPQKCTEDQQHIHDFLQKRGTLKTVNTAFQDFIFVNLVCGQEAKVLRDLNAAFPCIPDLETFRSVLDNKT